MNKPRLRWLWDSPGYGYLTYPHYNAFFGDGRYIVIRKKVNIADPSPSLHVYDLQRDVFTLFPNLPSGRTLIGGYWDVHYESGYFVSPEAPGQSSADGTNQRIWGINIMDFVATGSVNWEVLWEAQAIGQFIPTIPDAACSMHQNGAKIAFSLNVPLQAGDTYRRQLIEVDLIRKTQKTCCEKAFNLNHVHYMSFDPNWIMFSKDEAFTDPNPPYAVENTQRVWGYHRVKAPNGINYMPQVYPNSTRITHLSHEKAGYNKETVVAITYDGVANQRGVMKKNADYLFAYRISGGRSQHVDISRNGRWTVASTDETSPTGVGSGFDLQIIDNLLPNIIYANKDTVILSGGVDLRYLGITNGEAHPVFSPDGRYVLFQAAGDFADPVAAKGLKIGIIDTRNGDYDREYDPIAYGSPSA